MQKVGKHSLAEYLNCQYTFDQRVMESNESIQLEREIEKAESSSKYIMASSRLNLSTFASKILTVDMSVTLQTICNLVIKI